MNQEKDDIEKSPKASESKEEVDEVSLEVEGEESLEESGDITSLQHELADLHDQHIRLQAEFDNYRKRMNARYDEVTRFASEGIIMKVLNKLGTDGVVQTVHDDVHQNFISSNRMIIILRLPDLPIAIEMRLDFLRGETLQTVH